MKYITRESEFKEQLTNQIKTYKNNIVLDLGCGTATLTIMIKKTHSNAEVIGIDVDLKVLTIANSKVQKQGLYISLSQASAAQLPFEDNSFDQVVSSLVLHHLPKNIKTLALKEILRVLRHRGEFYVADIGKPQNMLMGFPSMIISHLEQAADNVKGLLPKQFEAAGFCKIQETNRYMTLYGTVRLYKMQKQ